jgi:hypothetical protein
MEKAEAKRQRRFDRKSATPDAEPASDGYESGDQVDGPAPPDEAQEPPGDGREE